MELPRADKVLGFYDTPLLTAEEEVTLAKRIEAGLYAGAILSSLGKPVDGAEPQTDGRQAEFPSAVAYGDDKDFQADLVTVYKEGKAAKDQFILANVRLVVAWASRKHGNHPEYENLVLEGKLGLIRAVEKFDYTLGYKFSTYAKSWIRQTIQRYLEKDGAVYKTQQVAVDLVKLKKAREALAAERRKPTDEALAGETGLSVDYVQELQVLAVPVVSLQATIADPKGWADSMLQDVMVDTDADTEEIVLEKLKYDTLHVLIALLTDRQKIAVRFYLSAKDNTNNSELARRIGVASHYTARTFWAKTLERLRELAAEREFNPYEEHD